MPQKWEIAPGWSLSFKSEQKKNSHTATSRYCMTAFSLLEACQPIKFSCFLKTPMVNRQKAF